MKGLRLVLLCCGVGMLCAPSGHAEGFGGKMFHRPATPFATLFNQTTETLGHLELYGDLSLFYLNDPLSGDDGARIIGFVRHRLAAEALLVLGLWDRFELGAALPVALVQQGTSTEGGDIGAGLGDVRVTARGRLWRHDTGAVSLGLGAAVVLGAPSGDTASFLGDGGVYVTPALVIDMAWRDHVRAALNVAYLIRSEKELGRSLMGNAAHLGLGIELNLGHPAVTALADVNTAVVAGPLNEKTARSVPLQLSGGVRWQATDALNVTGGAGVGLVTGLGVPDLELLLALGYRWGGSERPVPAPRAQVVTTAAATELTLAGQETTGPAVRIATVTAPSGASSSGPTKDTWQDPDPDDDGLVGALDRCPAAPEDYDQHEDEDGCPDPDNDADGVLDAEDRCPQTPETINGVQDQDGCPDEGRPWVAFNEREISIIQKQVLFLSGSDQLQRMAFKTLGQVAQLLKARWRIQRLLIEGHTDNQGDKEFNVDLSERRAYRVAQFLIDAGVAPARLETKGFGQTQPVATNRTAKGRAKNRRVVFRILTLAQEASP